MSKVDDKRFKLSCARNREEWYSSVAEFEEAVRDEALDGERPCNWHHADIPCKAKMELRWVCECCGHRELVKRRFERVTPNDFEEDEK